MFPGLLCAHLLAQLGVDIGNGDLGTEVGKREGSASAETARAAGDEGDAGEREREGRGGELGEGRGGHAGKRWRVVLGE